ncbi:MAG TPA: histidine kinase [Chthoniobacterales bacterium]|jgi:two-component sensor histidine kinase
MKNRSTPPRPPAAYWCCQVIGWSAFLFFLVFTSKTYTALSWNVVGGYLLLCVCGILVTHGWRGFILRRGWIDLSIGQLLPRVIAGNLTLSVLLVAVVWIYFLFLPPPHPVSWHADPEATVAAAATFVLDDFIILTLWSAIYFGAAFFKRQRRMEIESYQAQTALAEAELRGLKSQLNPHFFFNCLNSLRALVLEDPARAQEAITQMAAIVRYHLQSGERSLVPLAEEIATVEQYLALELIRFEDRLTIERAIDPGARLFLVPPLALQTLVENAVKYGISREAGPGIIRLGVQQNDSRLELSVRNTGSLRNDSGSGQSTGLGLTNLRTRLRLLFADRAALELHEPEAGWVEARLFLPLTKS